MWGNTTGNATSLSKKCSILSHNSSLILLPDNGKSPVCKELRKQYTFLQLMISWRLKCLSGAESDIHTIKGQHDMRKDYSSKVYRIKARMLRAAVKQHVPAKRNTVPLLTLHTQLLTTKANQRVNFHLSWLLGWIFPNSLR